MHQEQKIPTIKEVEKNWDNMTAIYSDFDSAPQSFYFSIINMLELDKAKNILQIGCGRCLLVPHCLELKKPQTTYLATDLSPKMIQQAQKRLKSSLQMNGSKFTFEQWCSKNKFTLKVANGEQIITNDVKFDRIICNMVLMLTQNASKMLKCLYQQAQQGCFLGVSVWGRRQLNLIQQELQRVADELKVQKPKVRSNFHLYNKVEGLAQEIGWKTVAKWEQVTTFPYLYTNRLQSYAQKMTSGMAYLTEDQKKWVYEEYIKRQKQRLDENKQALTFPAQLLIFRK